MKKLPTSQHELLRRSLCDVAEIVGRICHDVACVSACADLGYRIDDISLKDLRPRLVSEMGRILSLFDSLVMDESK